MNLMFILSAEERMYASTKYCLLYLIPFARHVWVTLTEAETFQRMYLFKSTIYQVPDEDNHLTKTYFYPDYESYSQAFVYRP